MHATRCLPSKTVKRLSVSNQGRFAATPWQDLVRLGTRLMAAPAASMRSAHVRFGRCPFQHVGRNQRVAALRVTASSNGELVEQVPPKSVSVVLLSGGVGKRMGALIPKQYLELRGRPIATHSLLTFARMQEVGEVVIVCEPSWQHVFREVLPGLRADLEIKWALPGAERQDSVFNGLQMVSDSAQLVAVHDSARPLVTEADVVACCKDALQGGAAVLGVPVKPTIKEVDDQLQVVKTLKRAVLWEVQTPQVIRPSILKAGFDLVKAQGLEVTDDVSIVEAMGLPVKITKGAYTNIKVTTPDDMFVAEKFMEEVEA